MIQNTGFKSIVKGSSEKDNNKYICIILKQECRVAQSAVQSALYYKYTNEANVYPE